MAISTRFELIAMTEHGKKEEISRVVGGASLLTLIEEIVDAFVKHCSLLFLNHGVRRWRGRFDRWTAG